MAMDVHELLKDSSPRVIIEEKQNHNRKAKAKPTDDSRLPTYHPLAGLWIEWKVLKVEWPNPATLSGLKTFKLNMEDDLCYVQQALEGLEQRLSCLVKGVKDLKREEEAFLEQSSRRNLGGHSMHYNQWAYGNFSPYAKYYEHNSYDCFEGNRLGARNVYNDKSYNRVPRNEVRNGGN
ncbi:hypothetical protein M9H77_02268 [Catharanthus roseus]|uniref:Uncharacterized protein n=1 Tax=Catharanthus roseus TaxID=4058 RepID=A0ACC0C8F8_CATRO|nr:hypothetical protein M9H77_02268 [Catharanthus roseus]